MATERTMAEGERLLGVDEAVDLAGEMSFPASDPPAWTPVVPGGPSSVRASPSGPELLRDVASRIRDDVHFFRGVLDVRDDVSPEGRRNLREAAVAIAAQFRAVGLPVKMRPAQKVGPANEPSKAEPTNVEAVILGGVRPAESVVVGAHYDSTCEGPAAGAAALAVLHALAHALSIVPLDRTVRLVAFADRRGEVGSVRYLDELLREGPRVVSMLAIGARAGLLGRFTESTGRRLGEGLSLVGDLHARASMTRAKAAFDRGGSGVTLSAVAIPFLGSRLGGADVHAFARRHVPALALMDLGASDKNEEASLADEADRLGRICSALTEMIRELASVPAAS